MDKTLHIGVSGQRGSFSEMAAQHYAKQQQWSVHLHYLLDMQTVLQQLNDNRIDYGLFPVVNNHAGLVTQAFQAMSHHAFSFQAYFTFPIQHCLITMPGISAQDITNIVSHPQALAQCQHTLTQHFPHAQRIEWIDTAEAAKALSEGNLNRCSTAVIAPQQAADCYGLTILQTGIQDHPDNATTFIVVKALFPEILASDSLETLRHHIDKLDTTLIKLLAQRSQISQQIGLLKQKTQHAIYDKSREIALRQQHFTLAKALALDETYIHALFDLILTESKRVQHNR